MRSRAFILVGLLEVSYYGKRGYIKVKKLMKLIFVGSLLVSLARLRITT